MLDTCMATVRGPDEQRPGDLAVGAALGDQREHLLPMTCGITNTGASVGVSSVSGMGPG